MSLLDEEIEKQSAVMAQLLRKILDPLVVDLLGEDWFAEFQSALAGYARNTTAQAYEEAERILEREIDSESEPEYAATNALASIRTLKDSLVASSN